MKNLFCLFIMIALLANCSATTSKRSTGETIDDNIIVVKLKSKFINDKIVKSSQIKTKSWKGVVTLSGVLDDQTAINRAIEIAEQQNGVKEVKAYLILKDTGVVDEPVIESATTETATDKAVAPPPATKKPVAPAKKPAKKPKSDRAVIETDISDEIDNSVTAPLNQKQNTNVKAKTSPTIENADYEEVKY